MDDLQPVKSFESCQNLPSNLSDDWNRKEGLIFLVSDIQIVFHEVSFNEQMFTVIEDAFKLYEILLIWVTVGADIPQNFYLI